jgi:hypothetical protein
MEEKITKTFTITANKSVMKRFENFMCFLHYNGGHSGLFAMSFDGDGSDVFKCDPPPFPVLKSEEDGYSLFGKCAGIGQDVEIASENYYYTYNLDRDRNHYLVRPDGNFRISPDGKRWKRNDSLRIWDEIE